MSDRSPNVEYLRLLVKDYIVQTWYEKDKIDNVLEEIKYKQTDSDADRMSYSVKMDSVDFVWQRIVEAMKNEDDKIEWKEIIRNQRPPYEICDQILSAIKGDRDDIGIYMCAQKATEAFLEYGWIPVFPEPKSELKM